VVSLVECGLGVAFARWVGWPCWALFVQRDNPSELRVC
jgi:hypothetical protein